MVEFSDILYGEIRLPEWLVPFIKLPEFVRLRGVRLSNVDSYQFKDFAGACRWEHSIGVAHLAVKCARKRQLSERETVHLVLSALMHDIATPPFAHTAEYVLDNFDHEYESECLLSGRRGKDFRPDGPVYASQLSQFPKACAKLARTMKISVDVEEIARTVIGEGDLGFLIHGTIDLDNIDNVTRACWHLGLDVERDAPVRIAHWLAEQRSAPTELEKLDEPLVDLWLKYRTYLYMRFYECTDEELGREAFLQHLIRHALKAGVPRHSIVWNTDAGLLSEFERFAEQKNSEVAKKLGQLTTRYRLLESPAKIAQIDIESKDVLRILRTPKAVEWIEEEISSNGLEAIVIARSRRHDGEDKESLFPPPPGRLLVFKLGQELKNNTLPMWVQEKVGDNLDRRAKIGNLSRCVKTEVDKWLNKKPWFEMTRKRKNDIVANLESVGDWGFSLTHNDNLHAYPSSFVYAIPANLITALNLQGETIVDPFGGIGQTAVEAIKFGGKAISADSNSLACLFARVKLTFLPSESRKRIRELDNERLAGYKPAGMPRVENLEKWFHKRTLDELSRIWRYIRGQREPAVKQFLVVCFSAILTSCTGRRGKHHTYFADNTPLPRGSEGPPYHNVYELFIGKVMKNLEVLERLYSHFEREGRSPEQELARAKVLKLDTLRSSPSDYGVEANSVGGIITSPPYLCMADYCHGLRLSYYWINPTGLSKDFTEELGARRYRKKPKFAIENYLDGLTKFAAMSSQLLRKGGFLATVFGQPTAKAFSKLDVIARFDAILREHGFELLWHRERYLHNRRMYGSMERERVGVHVFKG